MILPLMIGLYSLVSHSLSASSSLCGKYLKIMLTRSLSHTDILSLSLAPFLSHSRSLALSRSFAFSPFRTPSLFSSLSLSPIRSLSHFRALILFFLLSLKNGYILTLALRYSLSYIDICMYIYNNAPLLVYIRPNHE